MVDVARMAEFSLDLQMGAGHGGSYLRHEFFKGVGVLVEARFEVAVEAGLVARPVAMLVRPDGVQALGIDERAAHRHHDDVQGWRVGRLRISPARRSAYRCEERLGPLVALVLGQVRLRLALREPVALAAS
jgi:hypothetical protein